MPFAWFLATETPLHGSLQETSPLATKPPDQGALRQAATGSPPTPVYEGRSVLSCSLFGATFTGLGFWLLPTGTDVKFCPKKSSDRPRPREGLDHADGGEETGVQ